MTGIVLWFDDRKGFGFIQKASGPDVFVHRSDIEGHHSYRTLREGDDVLFEITSTPQGPKAVNVRRL